MLFYSTQNDILYSKNKKNYSQFHQLNAFLRLNLFCMLQFKTQTDDMLKALSVKMHHFFATKFIRQEPASGKTTRQLHREKSKTIKGKKQHNQDKIQMENKICKAKKKWRIFCKDASGVIMCGHAPFEVMQMTEQRIRMDEISLPHAEKTKRSTL